MARVTKLITCSHSSTGSYGSLARFRSVSRVKKVTDSCVVAASGDYADFQFLDRLTEYLTWAQSQYCMDKGEKEGGRWKGDRERKGSKEDWEDWEGGARWEERRRGRDEEGWEGREEWEGEGGEWRKERQKKKKKKERMRRKGEGMMLTSFYPALSQTPWTMVTTMHPSLSSPGWQGWCTTDGPESTPSGILSLLEDMMKRHRELCVCICVCMCVECHKTSSI